MYNFKRNQIIKLSLVGLTAIPLILLSYREYQGQPFAQTRNIIGCLAEVMVLVEAILKREESE